MTSPARRRLLSLAVALAGTAAVLGACDPAPTSAPPTSPDARPDASTDTPTPTASTTRASAPPSTPPPPEVLLAAGDIAACDRDGDEATARLLDDLDGVVAALGDLAYPSGTTEQFRDCYGPTWGRHRDRTRPAPGNHDYGTGSIDPYLEVFEDAAGPDGGGYYGYDLGPHWHAVALNTNCGSVGGCQAGSAQYRWLEAELDAHADQHVVAYGHHPRFSSGHHGSIEYLADLYTLMDQEGVDLYLAGHDHHYERHAPADPDGRPDPDGIRQFVVGTGGYSLYALGPELPTTEARTNDTLGILELELYPDAYLWRFHPTDPDAPSDEGQSSVP